MVGARNMKMSRINDQSFSGAKLTIINIANKMPKWVIDACDEYLKRINHGKYSCKVVEIKADKNPNKSGLENMAAEAKKIVAVIPTGSFIVALDEKGLKLNSQEFAANLDQITTKSSQVTFIVGGADGIHPDLKSKANQILQLSSLTFPHALVRVIILEQLYRSISILNNHPYHRN